MHDAYTKWDSGRKRWLCFQVIKIENQEENK